MRLVFIPSNSFRRKRLFWWATTAPRLRQIPSSFAFSKLRRGFSCAPSPLARGGGLLVVAVFEEFGGGTLQLAADGVEGGESYGLRLARLEDREVGEGDAHALGEFTERHLALGKHYVEVYDYHTAMLCWGVRW